MNIKAIGFDIGQTLVDYNAPLSWKPLFPDALHKVIHACNIVGENVNLDLATVI